MTDKVCAVQADSQWHEVQLTAEKILELVRGGCRYRDISVVCTDMATYKALCSLVLRRCGIPLYESGTEDILSKSVVATVLAALEAAGAADAQAITVWMEEGTFLSAFAENK